MSSIAEIIKAKRRELNLTPTKMAKRLGISSQLLSNYESGVHKPKIDFVLKWKSAFNEDILSSFIEKQQYSLVNDETFAGKTFKEKENSDYAVVPALLRIIEKQQETIHYLTTGKSQGGGEPPRKNASG